MQKIFKKLFFSFLFLFFSLAIFSCSKKKYDDLYNIPNAIVQKVKSKQYYNKVILYFNYKMINYFKDQDNRNIYISYSNLLGDQRTVPAYYDHNEKAWACECRELRNNVETNFFVTYEYKSPKTGKLEKRNIGSPIVEKASGDTRDPKDLIEINSVDDYKKIVKFNKEHFFENITYGDNFVESRDFILRNDLDFNGEDLEPIANTYIGYFNGNNKTIKNIKNTKYSVSEEVKILGDKPEKENEKQDFKKDRAGNIMKRSVHLNTGSIFNILGSTAKVEKLNFEQIKFKTEDISSDSTKYLEILNNPATRPFITRGFGILAPVIFEGVSVSDINFNNIDVDLTVYPGGSDPTAGLEKISDSRDFANSYGLLAGVILGDCKNITISNSNVSVRNLGSKGINLGLVCGVLAPGASLNFTKLIENNITITETLRPLFNEPNDNFLDSQIQQYPSLAKIIDTFKGTESSLLSSFVGNAVGHSKILKQNGLIATIIEKCNIEYKEDQNYKDYVICFLEGPAIGFDTIREPGGKYKDPNTNEEKIGSDFFIVKAEYKRLFKKGDKVKLYFDRGKRTFEPDFAKPKKDERIKNNNGFDILFINGLRINDNEIKQSDFSNDIFYYEFIINENTTCLSSFLHFEIDKKEKNENKEKETFYTFKTLEQNNGYNPRDPNGEGGQQQPDPQQNQVPEDLNNPKEDIFRINGHENEKELKAKLFDDVEFKIIDKYFNKNKHQFVIIEMEFGQKNLKTGSIKEHKTFARVNSRGIFRFKLIGKIKSISFISTFKSNIYIGTLAGYCEQASSVYLESNSILFKTDGSKMKNDFKNNLVSERGLQFGIVSGKKATKYKRIVVNKQTIKSENFKLLGEDLDAEITQKSDAILYQDNKPEIIFKDSNLNLSIITEKAFDGKNIEEIKRNLHEVSLKDASLNFFKEYFASK